MKNFLCHRSNRFGYDGWAVKLNGAKRPLKHTVCTTREEARALKRSFAPLVADRGIEVVKVRIIVDEV